MVEYHSDFIKLRKELLEEIQKITDRLGELDKRLAAIEAMTEAKFRIEEGKEVTLLDIALEEEITDKEGRKTVRPVGKWRLAANLTGVKLYKKE